MHQAIATKYLGPTNFRDSRVKATAQAGSITVPWDHALNLEENHRRAAEALARKFNWLSPGDVLIGGGLPDGNPACDCFVIVHVRGLAGFIRENATHLASPDEAATEILRYLAGTY